MAHRARAGVGEAGGQLDGPSRRGATCRPRNVSGRQPTPLLTSPMSSDATAAYATPRLLIEPLLPGDEARLEEIFRRAPDWSVVLDRPPTPTAAAEEIAGAAGSPGRVIAALRLVEGDEDVGAIGWWSSRPKGELALLGMLLVKPGFRG